MYPSLEKIGYAFKVVWKGILVGLPGFELAKRTGCNCGRCYEPAKNVMACNRRRQARPDLVQLPPTCQTVTDRCDVVRCGEPFNEGPRDHASRSTGLGTVYFQRPKGFRPLFRAGPFRARHGGGEVPRGQSSDHLPGEAPFGFLQVSDFHRLLGRSRGFLELALRLKGAREQMQRRPLKIVVGIPVLIRFQRLAQLAHSIREAPCP